MRADGKWRAAFEEGVRWVAPTQASSRLVMEDTEIRGCFIPKGDTVMTIQASANRDEDVFEDGENYNALRDPNPHQAFGNGPHHCAGAHLSRRTVGVILLPMLFERFPSMTLPDPASVRWYGFGFRGPLNLPVRLQSERRNEDIFFCCSAAVDRTHFRLGARRRVTQPVLRIDHLSPHKLTRRRDVAH